ncbi:MAG TPA: pyridoxal kinase [Woeseiaceae bacterium]|nr:pyridoxal kinase [Woeseiaceae bacterium]
MRRPNIVSIQSQLVYGCAGNNAAVPILRGLGATVYPVPTVLFSNTPHYPTIGGQVLAAPFIEDLLTTLLDRVRPAEIDAITTGYIGSAETARVVADFIDSVRSQHPGIVVLCDPVMGDGDVGLYVDDAVADAVCTQLIPRANIVTPNLFEAQCIVGDGSLTASGYSISLLRNDVKVAIVTGQFDESTNEVSTFASSSDEIWRVTTPRIHVRPTGTGDVFAAGFLYEWLVSDSIPSALERAVSLVLPLLERCLRTDCVEMMPEALEPTDFARPPAHSAQLVDRVAATRFE